MRVLYITFIVFYFDQLTKLVVKGFSIPFLNLEFRGMHYGQSYDVIGSFFRITFVENPGMAFGIGVNDEAKLFLSLFSIAASVGILFYLYKMREENLIFRISLALILAGALGNLVDRTFYGVFYGYAPLFYGKVVDFFNVDFFDFTIFGRTYERWPIFNIADASVTIGVIILLLVHRKIDDENTEDETEDSGSDDEKLIVGLQNNKEETDKIGGKNDETDIRKEIQV